MYSQTANIHLDFNGGIGLVQMMGKANIMALVGGGRQPKFAQNKVGYISVQLKLACLHYYRSYYGTIQRAKEFSKSQP